MVHLEYYLIVSTIMLFAGIFGFFIRRNTLGMLISVAISAAETAIAIAIMINIYRNIRSIQVDKLEDMKW